MEENANEMGKILKSINQSCIDLAREQLQKDPTGQVVWSNNHAYFIPSNATKDTDVVNLPMVIGSDTESARTVQLPDRTLSQLSVDIVEGKAMNITNLLRLR